MVVRLDHHAISFKRNPFFKDIRTHVTSAKRTAQPARRTTLAYGKRAHGPNTALVRSETFLMVQNWECLRTRHNIHTWLAAFGCRSCFWCQHYQLMRRCYPANCTFNACRGFPSFKASKIIHVFTFLLINITLATFLLWVGINFGKTGRTEVPCRKAALR